MTNPIDRARGLTVRFYGHSYPNWPDRWGYRRRLQDELGWDVTNAAFGGDLAMDTAARVIGSKAPMPWTYGAAHAVVVDCATNTACASGMGGLAEYRASLRAILSFISLEGPIDDSNITYVGNWWNENSGDRFLGSAKLGGDEVVLPTFGRSGRWAFGYCGLNAAAGPGATYDVRADGVTIGSLSCDQTAGTSSRTDFGSSNARIRGNIATIINVPAGTTNLRLVRTNFGGGPWADWWGKINELGSAPLIILPEPVNVRPSSYAGTAASDAVMGAYAQVLHQVAAEVGPHCLVVDTRTGWDSTAMTRASDGLHPNAQGHAHIASRIRDAIASSSWWPYTD